VFELFIDNKSGFAPKYINIFRGTLFISIFCVVSTPWNIIKNASGLLAFLSGYSCLMGPLAGVMVCDYYIIKKKKLNVDELYRHHGIYWYDYGFNWRAFASFFIGFLPLLPGFAKSIQPTLNVGGAWQIYTFAWLYGFFTALPAHYVICTYISPPTKSLVDVAVYPPHVQDEPTTVEGEEDSSEDGKQPYVAQEKEVTSAV
jgi:nucleobase:cation symporter-1, NCS1 family